MILTRVEKKYTSWLIIVDTYMIH